jgi:hypothetical protein
VTINRKEIRRQVRSGWCTRNVAALLLGFDLDLSLVDDLVERGLLATKTADDEQLLSAHDVLSHAGSELSAILNKRLPIDRHRRDAPQKEFRVLESTTARQCFQRQWDRLHRYVSRLIADPVERVTSGELRLIHQLMESARYYRRFDLTFTSKELQSATGLNRNYLPVACRALGRRGILPKKVDRAGTIGLNLVLLDPKTGDRFNECHGTEMMHVMPSTPWNSWDDA